jgi:hypothetical protein
MAGDKRKGKAVAEQQKKKTRQEKEWDHVLSVPDTQGQPQRGIRIGESAQGQGSSPRVSSSRLSSSSSYVAQAEVSSQQSRQSHLPHWRGPDLGLVEVTLSRS